MSAGPVVTRKDVEARIVKRCWENEAFRQELISDPTGCFSKYLNVPKAKLPKIVIHEEQAGSWHIVLPPKPAKAGELSDEELERVAGGTDISVDITVAVSAGVIEGSFDGLLDWGFSKSGW
jgi:hypothetical protein